MEQVEAEQKYEQVYGDTFALYRRKDMDEFVEPFEVRFRKNQFDPGKTFKEKRCFDAGCGNGRGTLFMLRHGAKHVTCYDLSEKNIASTRKFAHEYGYEASIAVKQGSLESIPFDDGAFDFVWCNGVIMHTGRPDKCLIEISRILKNDGQMWLYIYGAGGVYWRTIRHFRRMMKQIPIQNSIAMLKVLRYEPRYIAEFIDDWYASYLRTYTHRDLSARLVELGFESPEVLKFGMDYDTSHRLNSFYSSREREMMGEGDLRYLLTKTGKPVPGTPMSENELGSNYTWPKAVTDEIDPYFANLEALTAGNDVLRIAMASRVQRELRLLLSEVRPFPFAEMKRLLADTVDLIKQAK